MSIGNFPENLSQGILEGIILVERLGVAIGFNPRMDGRPKVSITIQDRLTPKRPKLSRNELFGPAKGLGPEDRCGIDCIVTT